MRFSRKPGTHSASTIRSPPGRWRSPFRFVSVGAASFLATLMRTVRPTSRILRSNRLSYTILSVHAESRYWESDSFAPDRSLCERWRLSKVAGQSLSWWSRALPQQRQGPLSRNRPPRPRIRLRSVISHGVTCAVRSAVESFWRSFSRRLASANRAELSFSKD